MYCAYVMTSSITISPASVMDSGIINKWMHEWMKETT
jgi:hypothetical protein